ncbi:MAG: type II toxin-antitoxin system RelE/ParE family toxin [Candidatus Riflebacteria bacterium]|nr:type II toxin-antitoxin system RelE/ParE family toxin [Candidatus Riflebacteria bacterium]
MKVRVWTVAEADAQADAADDWWRLHREVAPDVFLTELRGALNMLAIVPEVGRPYVHRRVQGVRRMLLPRTQYHVYYVYDATAAEVAVIAIWSARRRRGPRLRAVRSSPGEQ